MSQPSVRAEIEAIEAKKIEPAKAGSCSSTAPVGIVLEALRRYKAQALMPLESYPLRVEELSARGEIVQVMVYATRPSAQPSSSIPSGAFGCATGRW